MPPSIRRANGSVFHYTSAAGLLGLVEGGSLWASEATSLNDLAEVRHGWEVVKSWLLQQPPSESAELLSEMAENPLEQEHEVFVLSGSTAPDDANQWRLYAQGGNGYSVEIDPAVRLAAFSDAPEAERVIDDGSGGTTINIAWFFSENASVSPWYHVMYTVDETETALRELLASTAKAISSMKAPGRELDDADRSEERDVLHGKALEALGTIAHLTKEPGFSGENEVRTVATFLAADEHIRYRPGTHGIIGYGLLCPCPDGHPFGRVFHRPGGIEGSRPAGPLPIRSVRLGPLLHDEHVSTVRRLLSRNDLGDTDVEFSAVRLR